MSELSHDISAVAPHRWRWVALVALLIAEAMNLLDATIVQVAAPHHRRRSRRSGL